MPRTITIDNVWVSKVGLEKDLGGKLHVYAEYHLMSGNQAVQRKYEEITNALSAQRVGQLLAALDGVVNDLSAELT